MTSLFAKVGLKMSEDKTKAMISAGNDNYHSISDTAYKQRMLGEGESYQERKKRKLQCPECGTYMAEQYLPTHWEMHHDVPRTCKETSLCLEDTTGHFTINMGKSDRGYCTVPGCPASVSGIKTSFNMQRHFMARHNTATVTISCEGPLPQCPKCNMHVENVNDHQKTATCKKGTQQVQKQAEDIAHRAAKDVVFTLNDKAIENVEHFKYLGRWISRSDNDAKAMLENIKKARKKWSTFSRVLIQEGADHKTMGTFYKTIILAILLYSAETWTLTQKQLSVLSSFHNHCARLITDRKAHEIKEGEWHWPSLSETLKLAGLETIKKYIQSRREHYIPYAKTQALYRKCLRTHRNPSKSHKMLWWKQIE
jgi:hypothetical protein